MKCKIHGYEHHKDCRYCNDVNLWIPDDEPLTKKKLKWHKSALKRGKE